MVLLPIAYWTFFLMMNRRSLMGADRPEGGARLRWNTLMLLAAGIATYASLFSAWKKAGWYGLGALAAFLAWCIDPASIGRIVTNAHDLLRGTMAGLFQREPDPALFGNTSPLFESLARNDTPAPGERPERTADGGHRGTVARPGRTATAAQMSRAAAEVRRYMYCTGARRTMPAGDGQPELPLANLRYLYSVCCDAARAEGEPQRVRCLEEAVARG